MATASDLSVVDETAGPDGILAMSGKAEETPTMPADLEDQPFTDYNTVANRTGRRLFESDHAFDGFVQPFSNPIQFKDPRAMTEARGIFLAAWSDPAMPLGDTTAQVYALQLRAAVTERLEVFAAGLAPRKSAGQRRPAAAVPAPSHAGGRWTFLTNHAHVLILLSKAPTTVLRKVALQVGITERAVQRIIADLERDGFIERHKVGRQNSYRIRPEKPLRHPIEAHRTIGDLIDLT